MLIVAAVAVVLILTLGQAKYTSSTLEKKLISAIQRNGDTVTTVSCPSSIKASAGNTYTCNATVNGSLARLQVRFIGDKKFVATYLSQ